MPDTEKVIQLSRIFQVSTDYLLLDEIEEPAEREKKGTEPAETPFKRDAVSERRRRLRIAFGAVLAALGIAVGVTALFLTQAYADSLMAWETDLGKFGTALLQSWRGGVLACGVLVLVGGIAVLIREYFRED